MQLVFLTYMFKERQTNLEIFELINLGPYFDKFLPVPLVGVSGQFFQQPKSSKPSKVINIAQPLSNKNKKHFFFCLSDKNPIRF